MLNSENAFLSTLQPDTPSTTYALPSDNQIGNGTALSGEAARTRRVHEQIKMKLAEKSTLPRQNGGTSHYAMSDHGGSSAMKYSTYNPSYSSKSSYMYSKTLDPRISHRTEFSSRSAAPNVAQFQRMSVGVGGGGGGGFYREDMRTGGFQGSIRQNRMDHDAMSLHSLRTGPAMNAWVPDNSDAGSMVSDRDATFGRQYTQSAMNGYSTQIKQGGGTMSYQTEVQTPELTTMRRSLSGTLARGASMIGGGGGGTEMIHQQQSFRGPAHRTISRIANRNRSSVGSMYGTQMTSSAGNLGAGGDLVDRGGFVMSTLGSGSQGNLLQRQGTMTRSMSIRSMQSVGKGMDIYGQEDWEDLPHLQGVQNLDLDTATEYLKSDDYGLKTMGAAYIQHLCYHDKEAKDEVRTSLALDDLVKNINHENQEVRRYVTGAIRNVIYQNMENKTAFISRSGLEELSKALETADDDLYKNITGILWNLSSRDSHKERLAKETLPQLCKNVIAPICEQEGKAVEAMKDGGEVLEQTNSQKEIFTNASGCLRNLSSGNEKTRQLMRDTQGLVKSLVTYISAAIEKGKVEEKEVENCVCILRNLSFQIYSELPPSLNILMTRIEKTHAPETVGCFSPKSFVTKNEMEPNKRLIFNKLTHKKTDTEWLLHPDIVDMYVQLLKKCEINATTREAALGALQNITVGDFQWCEGLCNHIVYKARAVPHLLDYLHTDRNTELRSLTGLLRNISRHVKIQDAVNALVKKLPNNAGDKDPSSEVVVNMCGVLNNLVMQSYDTARTITDNGGLQKLMDIKTTADQDCSTEALKKGKAAATVLANMYNYRKLHKDFKKSGYQKKDFVMPKSEGF